MKPEGLIRWGVRHGVKVAVEPSPLLGCYRVFVSFEDEWGPRHTSKAYTEADFAQQEAMMLELKSAVAALKEWTPPAVNRWALLEDATTSR